MEACVTVIQRRQQRVRLAFGGLLVLALWFGARALSSAQAVLPPLSYTLAQADKAEPVYAEHCASCHGANLDDGAYGPPLKGADFRTKWDKGSVEPLFSYLSARSPPPRPGTLGDEGYRQLLAHILLE